MLFESLKKRLPRIKENELLKNHCTFRVGGPADLFYELRDIEELPTLIQWAEENHVSYFMFGQGSNILFGDGGFRGLVIKNYANRIVVDDTTITADSGLVLAMLIVKMLEHELSGLESLYGLPGTVGGAVYGNAGVPGCEFSDFLRYITVYNIETGVRRVEKNDITFSYRPSRLQNQKDVILTVTIELKTGSKEHSKAEMKKIDTARRDKQPVGFTCGSFFKNPSKEKPAGMLIDKAELKGTRIGGAQISEKHGNFFMNVGDATAGDILSLSELAQKTVKEKFDITLEREVRIIGEL